MTSRGESLAARATRGWDHATQVLDRRHVWILSFVGVHDFWSFDPWMLALIAIVLFGSLALGGLTIPRAVGPDYEVVAGASRAWA
jgi:hypothetical protein